MENTIANQATPSQVTGRLATWHRLMEEAGLTYDDLQTPIDDPGLRQRLVRFWRSGCTDPNAFAVWKTITIGGVPKDKLVKQLQDGGYDVGDWAKDMVSKPAFTTLPQQQTITLARACVRDFGFTAKPTTNELWARIKQVGELCPAEAGPHLRLQFPDQKKGDICWLAMEQITDSDGYPDVFSVERSDDGDRWLIGDCAFPGYRWDLDLVLVFVLRK